MRFGAAYGLSLCALAALVAASAPAASRGSFASVAAVVRLWAAGGPVHVTPNAGLWWYLTALAYREMRPALVAAQPKGGANSSTVSARHKVNPGPARVPWDLVPAGRFAGQPVLASSC